MVHASLASYFAAQPLNVLSSEKSIPNLRALSELPYQYAKSAQWSDYVRTLSDFNFLQTKTAAVGPVSLIEDYDWFPLQDRGGEEVDLQLIQDSLRLCTQTVTKDPDQLAGQLLGRLLGSESVIIGSLLDQASKWRAATWLRPLSPSLTLPGGPLVCTLQGHSSPIDAVALTADGKLAVSGDVRGELIVWDLDHSSKLHELHGHEFYITTICITPDARRAISGSYDGTIRVWDLDQGKLVHVLRGHRMSIFSLAMTKDGSRAASGCMKTLRVWDLDNGMELGFSKHKGNGLDVTIDESKGIAFCQSGKEILQFDLETGKKLPAQKVKKAGAYFRAITAEGKLGFSHNSGIAYIWDVKTGKEIGTLKGHRSSIQGLSLTPDGGWLATASSDHTLRVWDIASQSEEHCYEHPAQVRCTYVTADGRFVISGSQDHSIRVWDTHRKESKAGIVSHSQEVSDVAISPDESLGASTGDDCIHIWDMKSAELIRTITSPGKNFNNLKFAGNDRLVSAEWKDNPLLTLWDVATGKSLANMSGHHGGVWALAVSRDGRSALSGSKDLSFIYWDLDKTAQVWHGFGREGLRDEVMAAAFLPGEQQVLLGYF